MSRTSTIDRNWIRLGKSVPISIVTARDSYARRFAEESGEKTTEGELNRPECDAALRSKDRLETAHEVVDLEFEDGGSSPYGDRDPFLRRNCGRPLGIGD